MKVITTSSRGQITIPKKIRDRFDTDYFKISTKGDSIVLTPFEPDLRPGLAELLDAAYQDYLEHGGYTLEEVIAKSEKLD